MTKLILFSICLNLLFSSSLYSGQNPEANREAMVHAGDVRFTILTPQLIRMEWSPDSVFEDRASLVFTHRRLPVPEFICDEDNGWLVIQTGKLKIRYRTGSGPFAEDNLAVSFQVGDRSVTWNPGTRDSLNLRGTTRTLDDWNGGSPEKLEPGLLSRDGWTVVDDSRRLLFDDAEWRWVAQRPPGERQDWYFFGYGHEYKQCLNDFTKVAGKIPMPPRFAFGYWWSRYWVYSDAELRQLISEFRARDLPIDVLVVDMDWHETYGLGLEDKRRDPFGQRIGWTGYTWNRSLFPNPEGFLQWAEDQQLKIALNLHPASGIPPMEERYAEFADAVGFDTTGNGYIPFEIEKKPFAEKYFDVLLKPLEKAGVDFWWLDWQQWPEAKSLKGLNNTWWLNYAFFSRMERSGKRPLLFHRWGGLGNHRYQVGFSGDAIVSWASLTFQTYFTPTASNVGYGYWSHDIGGHNPMGLTTEPELYLRWLQFGTFSPILRTHSTKSTIMERRFWMFPEYFNMMKAAVEFRYELAPYIYSAARQAYDTGISICRPMYYEHPKAAEAYEFKHQYYFGDDMIVAPVTESVDSANRLVKKKIWLPPGDWFEWFSGTMLKGNRTVYRKYALSEVPLFVRSGAIIPMNPKVRNLQAPVDTLVLTFVPGADGEVDVYEDDGVSTQYRNDRFTRTRVKTEYRPGEQMLIVIHAREGEFSGMTEERAYEIRLPNSLPPERVLVNGRKYGHQNQLRPQSWRYSARNLATNILTGPVSCGENIEIQIDFSPSGDTKELLSGKRGKFRRLTETVANLKVAAGGDFAIPNGLYALEQTGTRIQYQPEMALPELQRFSDSLPQLHEALSSVSAKDSSLVEKTIAYLDLAVTGREIEEEERFRTKLQTLSGRIQLGHPFSNKYPAGGITALFDKRLGTQNYLDPAWQGYEGVDFSLTVDWGKGISPKQISVRFLQDIAVWIFLPTEVRFSVSDNGHVFHEVASIRHLTPANSSGRRIKSFTKKFGAGGKTFRYLRVEADNLAVCPAWHHGAGGGLGFLWMRSLLIDCISDQRGGKT